MGSVQGDHGAVVGQEKRITAAACEELDLSGRLALVGFKAEWKFAINGRSRLSDSGLMA
jgi:hypothetical protein